MKKTTKGALAAGAAAVLLLGGAGSLAYWSDSDNVNGGTFATGNVALAANDCSTAPWTYTTTNHATGDVVDGLVPGDSITKDCTATVTGTGDHLYASLDVPDTVTYTSTPASTTLSATVATTFDVDGTTYSSGDAFAVPTGTHTVTVHYTVTFPYGDATATNANDTQSLTVNLDAITLTLTQVDPATQS